MSGYTPVFRSVFTGSLTGKWPDTGLWISLLALADKNGELDYTSQYISMVTGLDLAEVDACLARFMEPDPMSRSPDDDGRRLVLTDPPRQWGWRIVNFVTYREKARKAAFDSQRVADGRNAERMAARRDPTGPAKTRVNPPSDSDANTDSDYGELRSSSPKTVKSSSSDKRDSDDLQNREAKRRAVAKLAASAIGGITNG